MRSINKATTLCVLLMLLSAPASFAQTATGEVNGTIMDQSGALLAGATVVLTNQATKIQSTTTTTGSGYFIFISLPPGGYALKVEKSGFKSVDIPEFQVGVSQSITQNLKMPVGSVSENVEVTSAAPLVDRSTTELGAVIETRAVNDLPLNGRNFTQLLTLTPGVTPVSTSQNKSIGCCEGNVGLPGSGFSDGSFHGQQNRSKLYFYDGIVNTNIRGPTYIVIPNIDLIQEFKVVGHDAKAEFGGASGGVVNLVSKSGGNSFHGSAFEYLRNNFFDARNSVTDGPNGCTIARCPNPGQVVPSGPTPFRQNQFGAAVTGPIIRNRTFFSAGYDGWRYSQADQNLSRVPTAAELAGDFSNSGTNAADLYNPYSTRVTNPATCSAATGAGCTYTRDQFRCDAAGNPLPLLPGTQVQSQTTGAPCRKIPQALIFAPMQQFFQTYAAAPNIVDPTGTNNFVRDRATLNNSNSFTARVDHRFRDQDNVFFRYTEQRNTIFTPIGSDGWTAGGSQGRNYGGGWTHLFRPTLILDVRAGYAGRPGVDASQQNDHTAGLAGLKKLGFVDVDKYHGFLATASGYSAGGNNNIGIRGASPRENPNWSLTPNVSWLKGRHNLRAGGWFIDAKRIQLNTFQTYNFSSAQTQQIGGSGGNAMASAMLGLPNTFNGQLPIPHGGPVEFKYASWATYLQDEWKVLPTVTLTMGLRYDYVTQPQTLDGRLWNAIDLDNRVYLVGAAALPALCSSVNAPPCIPDAFLKDPHANSLVAAGKRFFSPPPIKDNWGPRVGVAWAFTPRTVVRAGYGLYWDSITARSQYAQNNLEAYVWPDSTAFSGSANSCANNSTCAFTNGTAISVIQQQQAGLSTPLPTYTGVTGLPWNGFPNNNENSVDYKDPYTHEWNFELQRELTPTTMISAAYVGSRTGRLPYTGNANAGGQATACAAVTPTKVNGSCTAAENAAVDATRPMPWVSSGLSLSRSIGFAHYNALESRLQKRFSGGLTSILSYTWGKSTDVTSGYFNGAENGPGGGSTVQNYFDQNSARGQSSYNIGQFVSWATVYELPFGRGKRWLASGPLSWIAGNWQSNYIFQVRSGQPYNVQVSGDVAHIGGSGPGSPGTYARPNLIADPFVAGPVAANPDPACQKTLSQGGKAADQTHTLDSWFNPCAFGIPVNSFGNVGRNAFNGPHVVNVDYSMFKSVPITERVSIQLRFEAFNIFNIQNYDVPSSLTLNSGTVNPATGGSCTGTTGACVAGITKGAGKITALAQGTTPRQLQFGLRVQF